MRKYSKRKKYILVLMIVFIILVFCSTSDDYDLFDSNQIYSGFSNADYDLSIDDCEKQGFVILEGFEITKNRVLLDSFIEESAAEKNSYIRIASFNDESSEVAFYSDLVFDSDGYSFFYDDQKDMTKNPYKYLKILEGSWGIPLQEYKMIVICDRESITFDEVNQSMVSSSTVVINKIGRFKIIIYRY